MICRLREIPVKVAGEDVKKLDFSHVAGGNAQRYNHFWRELNFFLKPTTWSFHPTPTICSREMKTYVCANTCARMCVCKGQKWKQPNSPSKGGFVNGVCGVCTRWSTQWSTRNNEDDVCGVCTRWDTRNNNPTIDAHSGVMTVKVIILSDTGLKKRVGLYDSMYINF